MLSKYWSITYSTLSRIPDIHTAIVDESRHENILYILSLYVGLERARAVKNLIQDDVLRIFEKCLCVEDFRIQSIVYRLFAQILMIDEASTGFSALLEYRNGYFVAPILSYLRHQEPLMRISTLTFLDAVLGAPDGFPWINGQKDILLEIVRCLHDSSQFVVQSASVFLSKFIGNPRRSATCDFAFQILLSTNLNSSLHDLHGSKSPLERLSYLEFVWSILKKDVLKCDIIQLPELISKTVELLYDSNKLVRSMSTQIISTVISENVSDFFHLADVSPVYLYYHVVSPLLLHLQPEIAATGLRCFSALIKSRHISQRDLRFFTFITFHLGSAAFNVNYDRFQYLNDSQYEDDIYNFDMWKQRFETSGFNFIFRRKPNREIQTCVASTIETLVLTRTLSDNEFLTLGDLLSLLLQKDHSYATFTHIMASIQHMLQQLNKVNCEVQTAFFNNILPALFALILRSPSSTKLSFHASLPPSQVTLCINLIGKFATSDVLDASKLFFKSYSTTLQELVDNFKFDMDWDIRDSIVNLVRDIICHHTRCSPKENEWLHHLTGDYDLLQVLVDKLNDDEGYVRKNVIDSVKTIVDRPSGFQYIQPFLRRHLKAIIDMLFDSEAIVRRSVLEFVNTLCAGKDDDEIPLANELFGSDEEGDDRVVGFISKNEVSQLSSDADWEVRRRLIWVLHKLCTAYQTDLGKTDVIFRRFWRFFKIHGDDTLLELTMDSSRIVRIESTHALYEIYKFISHSILPSVPSVATTSTNLDNGSNKRSNPPYLTFAEIQRLLLDFYRKIQPDIIGIDYMENEELYSSLIMSAHKTNFTEQDELDIKTLERKFMEESLNLDNWLEERVYNTKTNGLSGCGHSEWGCVHGQDDSEYDDAQSMNSNNREDDELYENTMDCY